MDQIVASLGHRTGSTTSHATLSSDNDSRCPLLDLPEEIRRVIYAFLAPDLFLLAAPHADYYSLFYSCRQIRNEMTRESLRPTLAILRRAKRASLEKLFDPASLPPAAPQLALSMLMNNITISLTETLIFSFHAQVSWLASYEPLFKLHLNNLTLHLPEEYHVLSAYGAAGALWNTFLDYKDIVPFATRINCVVAGQLCLQDHDRNHRYCIRPLPGQLSDKERLLRLTPNVRVITLHFARLGRYGGWNSKRRGPSKDRSTLETHFGWSYSEKIVGHSKRHREKDVEMVWTKMDIERKGLQMWSRWKKPDGKLLKGIGESQKDEKVKWYRRAYKKQAGTVRK